MRSYTFYNIVVSYSIYTLPLLFIKEWLVFWLFLFILLVSIPLETNFDKSPLFDQRRRLVHFSLFFPSFSLFRKYLFVEPVP